MDARISSIDFLMKRNGTLIAHGREWPLYERWGNFRMPARGCSEAVLLVPVLRLEMSDVDRVAKEKLDEAALRYPSSN